jgi:hypothetical protein
MYTSQSGLCAAGEGINTNSMALHPYLTRTTHIMDSLPVELLSNIANHLHGWTMIDPPYCQGTGWHFHTKASREAICNFRLVCRRFGHASVSNFGELLGDRRFRLTKVGLEDLQAMSAVASLQPHIRTLTFGGSRFSTLKAGENDALVETLKLLPDPHLGRLANAYHEAYLWQLSHGGTHCQPRLEAILASLPNLRTTKFILSDTAKPETHLGGWLSSGDKEILMAAWPYAPDDGANIYDLDCSDLQVFNPVLHAMGAAGKAIEDLQFGIGGAEAPSSRCLLHLLHSPSFSNLHHLRIGVLLSQLCLPSGNPDNYLARAFMSLTKLTYLWLDLDQEGNATHIGLANTTLIRILKNSFRLEQLTLAGHWKYSPDNVLDIVSSQEETLQVFTIRNPILVDGDWALVMSRLVQLQPRQLAAFTLYLENPPANIANQDDWDLFLEGCKTRLRETRKILGKSCYWVWKLYIRSLRKASLEETAKR